MKRILFAQVLGFVLIGTGCGTTPGNKDAGDNNDGGVSCDPFTNEGTIVNSTLHADAPPAMTGGEIGVGTYLLVAEDFYNGESDSHTWQETFVFSAGNTVKHVGLMDGAQSVIAGTYSTSATTLTLNMECPHTASLDLQYTATPTTLSFISPDDPNHLQTYYKQ